MPTQVFVCTNHNHSWSFHVTNYLVLHAFCGRMQHSLQWELYPLLAMKSHFCCIKIRSYNEQNPPSNPKSIWNLIKQLVHLMILMSIMMMIFLNWKFSLQSKWIFFTHLSSIYFVLFARFFSWHDYIESVI